MEIIPLADLASKLNDKAGEWSPAEAAAFLITGTLALGDSGALEGDQRDGLLRALVQGAFDLDDASRNLRDITLSGLDDWPAFPGDGPPLPPVGEDCLGDVLQAAGRAGDYIQQSSGASVNLSVDANGITSIVPSGGSAGDTVRINGSFPMPPPVNRRVLFPRAGGGNLEAMLTNTGWNQAFIDVYAPEPPGDGKVGFATSAPGSESLGDATALVEFGDSLAGCLGPTGAAIGGRLNSVAPPGAMTPLEIIPTLPNDANVFHGGPVLVSVSASAGSELDPAIVVLDLNLRSGDIVYLEHTACPTAFVSGTRLTFRPAAMASGHKLLQIGRSYHRSNGVNIELLATLEIPNPPARVLPDTFVKLKGSGFGPDISVTIDGNPAAVQVIDSHTIQIKVSRPVRTPAIAERTGEPVTVEVFDRYLSIGALTVLVATFRIATFGDSIVWGQGLPVAQRFSSLVADEISARRGGRIAVFAVDHCARSGAMISLSKPVTPLRKIPRLPGDFSGECPSGESIRDQVAAWPAFFSSELSQVDLVIVDGGINDVGVQTILDSRGDDTALARLTTIVCGSDMTALLSDILTAFPAARVVVTGYYPIVSIESNLDFLLALLGGLGLLVGLASGIATGVSTAISSIIELPGIPPVAFGSFAQVGVRAWIQARLVARSTLFATTANTALANAVAAMNRIVPSRAITFAAPSFSPANAIFASDTFLYGCTVSLGPEDPIAATRAACTPPSFVTTLASIGHPNARGARAFADAIIAALPSIGL
ncbi:MAG: hypothetical protein H6R24_490 [Proteobacteria bacterium]|nr:hypothetical protein [Pseudomonadota bacterium]